MKPIGIIGEQMDILFNAGKSKETNIRLEVCDKCEKSVSDFIVEEEAVWCKSCVDEVGEMCVQND